MPPQNCSPRGKRIGADDQRPQELAPYFECSRWSCSEKREPHVGRHVRRTLRARKTHRRYGRVNTEVAHVAAGDLLENGFAARCRAPLALGGWTHFYVKGTRASRREGRATCPRYECSLLAIFIAAAIESS